MGSSAYFGGHQVNPHMTVDEPLNPSLLTGSILTANPKDSWESSWETVAVRRPLYRHDVPQSIPTAFPLNHHLPQLTILYQYQQFIIFIINY